MKKTVFIAIILSNIFLPLIGQRFSISHDRYITLYIGVDNPISIAVENLPSKSIIVKTDNGEIERNYPGGYTFTSKQVGATNIILYKKVNGHLKKIGSKTFIVKKFPTPIFMIGSGRDSMPLIDLQNQQFVRAELQGDFYFSFDVRFSVVSFTVCIISTDTCRYKELNNVGNKISEEIRTEFSTLKPNDIVIFKNIICSGPVGREALKPRMALLY